ncbi:MAG: hypothetical protein R3D51_01140 [Hyphomicrobiaceae bacterium]
MSIGRTDHKATSKIAGMLLGLFGGSLLFAVMATASVADEAITLEMSAHDGARLTVVEDSNGKLSVRENELSLSLALAAKADPARGLRLVASQLYLKQAGREAGATRLLADLTGARTFAHKADVAFALDPIGPLARNAVALCSGTVLPDLSATASVHLDMSVPVVWRVNAGHLDFAALAMSGITATDEVLASPSYYTNADSAEREVVARVEIRCENHGGSAAVASSTAKRGDTTGASGKASAQGVKVEKVAIRSDESVNPEPRHSSADPASMVCEGGMVRALSGDTAGQACLCPGNTVRRPTGANAFVCQRRHVRRR